MTPGVQVVDLEMAVRSVPDSCEICDHNKADINNTKVLPCFHTLCEECISGLKLENVAELEVRCPVERCGKPFKLERDNSTNLPDAYPVKHQLELAQLKAKVEKGEVLCEANLHPSSEENLKAFSVCNECGLLCEKCHQVHRKHNETKYSDHETIPLEDIVQSQDDTAFHQEVKRKRTMSCSQEMQCSTHAMKYTNKYCQSCSAFVCRNCIEVEHRNHVLRTIQEESERQKEVIKQKLPDVCSARERMAVAFTGVIEAKEKVNNQQKLLATSIDRTFDQVRKRLSRTQQDLHKTLDNLTSSKLRQLQKQQATLDTMVKELKRLEDFTGNSLETSTVKELLTNSKFLQERIDSLLEEISLVPTEPTELPNLSFKDSITPQNLVQQMGQKKLKIFTKQADALNCTAEGPGLINAEVSKAAHFVVNVVDKQNKPCSSFQNVTVKVECLRNEHSLPGDVNELALSRYEVTFTPEFPGDHNLHVYVNDAKIAGSPFLLHVQKHIGVSQGTISGLKGPRALTITDDDDILVCEMNGGKITKLDKHHRQVETFGNGSLSHPAGISSDSDGNLYVVDKSLNRSCLVKFNSHGELLKSVGGTGSKAAEFKNPCGVKVNRKNTLIYVCDRDNHRIQIFNSDLEYTWCISLEKVDDISLKFPCKPSDIVFDKQGNIYITDYANHSILVFSSAEEYITNYSTKDPEDQSHQLGGPDSIAIDESGLLYVTVSHAHRVLVFKTSGEFVKGFGVEGQREGELKLPMGIDISRNGTGSIYVCEFLNNRVQTFY